MADALVIRVTKTIAVALSVLAAEIDMVASSDKAAVAKIGKK
jgi:hypothetical protein